MASETNKARKERKARKNPAKRLSILKAAEAVFADKGFHEATISDIAKRAHVSEATIYEYFSSKEELLFSIPSEITREHLAKSREILQYIQGAENKLRVVICRHLRLYVLNPEYAKVAMLILKTNRNFLKTDDYKVVQESARLTISVLQEGMANGEFRPDLNPHLVRAMIWGTVEHLVIRKSLLGKPQDLLSLAEEIITTLFKGILIPKKDPTLNINVTVERKD